jgi:hypothetical protein
VAGPLIGLPAITMAASEGESNSSSLVKTNNWLFLVGSSVHSRFS